MDRLSDSGDSFIWSVISNVSSIGDTTDSEIMSPEKFENENIDSLKKNNVNKHLEDMESSADIVKPKKRKNRQSIVTDPEDHYSPKKRKLHNDETHEEDTDRKKIHQKIVFENSNDLDYIDVKVKREELLAAERSKKKKLKKHKDFINLNESEDYIDVKVKREELLAAERSKKKKLKKHKDSINLNESEDFVENYSHSDVKQEASGHDSVKIKKNKKHKNLDLNNGSVEADELSLTASLKHEHLSDTTPVKLKKKKKSKHSVSSNFESNSDNEKVDYLNIKVKEEDDSFTKPKVKKKKRNLENANETQNVSLESVVDTPKKKKNRKSNSINEESESDQHTLSETIHLESSRLNKVEQISNTVSSENKNNTTSNDSHVRSPGKKRDKKLSSHIASDEPTSEEKQNDSVETVVEKPRKISVNNNFGDNISKGQPKISNAVLNSPQGQSPRKNISKEIVSEDSSSDDDSTEDKRKSSQSNNYLKRTISNGNNISGSSDEDVENSPVPPPTSHKNNNKSIGSTSSDSSDENNSVQNKHASPTSTSKSTKSLKDKNQVHQSSRTFSKNYDTSDDTSSDQDKAQKPPKSPQVGRQSISNVSNGTVEKASSSDEDRGVSSESLLKSPKKKSISSNKDSRFESEDDTDDNNDSLSSKLQLYQKSNTKLCPIVSKPNSNSVITDDDEIWILKCPSDVIVGTLKDSEFLLDKKCKFKMNGETYHGTIENDIEKIAITTFEHNRFVIKNLPLNGVVHVKKRIPKQHVQDDSMLMQSHNEFIPLPETKRRHPFFGADYKKAIKVPKRIVRYLKADSEHFESPERDMKERKKKDKKILKERETEFVKVEQQEVADEVVPEKRKKAKKRKHDDTDEVPAKKSKKIKHKSSEVWDSEKAIEENLFNY